MGLKERRERAIAEKDAYTPLGQARLALEDGRRLLQLKIKAQDANEVLDEVCALGWTLEHVAAVWAPAGNVTTGGIHTGDIVGLYVFARI